MILCRFTLCDGEVTMGGPAWVDRVARLPLGFRVDLDPVSLVILELLIAPVLRPLALDRSVAELVRRPRSPCTLGWVVRLTR